ncbi:mediator of RNA polymerase II transcription subunit 11-like [Asterias rubens]|uniref:mediator of RNA polymerase II transcription subunit 11-like n=1 Tax=Asterias rubens TaxID=7604 RepID=UPI00145529C0|nr:mediator of RNA polymerase II transcription subunit 11-like [Asterias rubens]
MQTVHAAVTHTHSTRYCMLFCEIMTSPTENRLKQLEIIENDIANVVLNAGRAVGELSEDKPNEHLTEHYTRQFLKTLEKVEKSLSEQINYLSQVATGQPHEGSSYSAQKDAQMAIHRQEHLKSELNELGKICGASEGQ